MVKDGPWMYIDVARSLKGYLWFLLIPGRRENGSAEDMGQAAGRGAWRTLWLEEIFTR
jgi:hypothetical protein